MISAFLLAASFCINTLPDVTHIDGEVSTNIVLNISPKLSEFSLDFSLEATLSNTVEVAFGEDGDFDGDLAHYEIDLIVGCECGQWRIVDATTGVAFDDLSFYGASDFKWCVWVAQSGENAKLKASLNGSPVFWDLPSFVPLFKRSWTHLKITSRGDDQSFGALEVKQSDGWFYVVIR